MIIQFKKDPLPNKNDRSSFEFRYYLQNIDLENSQFEENDIKYLKEILLEKHARSLSDFKKDQIYYISLYDFTKETWPLTLLQKLNLSDSEMCELITLSHENYKSTTTKNLMLFYKDKQLNEIPGEIAKYIWLHKPVSWDDTQETQTTLVEDMKNLNHILTKLAQTYKNTISEQEFKKTLQDLAKYKNCKMGLPQLNEFCIKNMPTLTEGLSNEILDFIVLNTSWHISVFSLIKDLKELDMDSPCIQNMFYIIAKEPYLPNSNSINKLIELQYVKKLLEKENLTQVECDSFYKIYQAAYASNIQGKINSKIKETLLSPSTTIINNIGKLYYLKDLPACPKTDSIDVNQLNDYGKYTCLSSWLQNTKYDDFIKLYNTLSDQSMKTYFKEKVLISKYLKNVWDKNYALVKTIHGDNEIITNLLKDTNYQNNSSLIDNIIKFEIDIKDIKNELKPLLCSINLLCQNNLTQEKLNLIQSVYDNNWQLYFSQPDIKFNNPSCLMDNIIKFNIDTKNIKNELKSLFEKIQANHFKKEGIALIIEVYDSMSLEYLNNHNIKFDTIRNASSNIEKYQIDITKIKDQLQDLFKNIDVFDTNFNKDELKLIAVYYGDELNVKIQKFIPNNLNIMHLKRINDFKIPNLSQDIQNKIKEMTIKWQQVNFYEDDSKEAATLYIKIKLDNKDFSLGDLSAIYHMKPIIRSKLESMDLLTKPLSKDLTNLIGQIYSSPADYLKVALEKTTNINTAVKNILECEFFRSSLSCINIYYDKLDYNTFSNQELILLQKTLVDQKDFLTLCKMYDKLDSNPKKDVLLNLDYISNGEINNILSKVDENVAEQYIEKHFSQIISNCNNLDNKYKKLLINIAFENKSFTQITNLYSTQQDLQAYIKNNFKNLNSWQDHDLESDEINLIKTIYQDNLYEYVDMSLEKTDIIKRNFELLGIQENNPLLMIGGGLAGVLFLILGIVGIVKYSQNDNLSVKSESDKNTPSLIFEKQDTIE